MLVLTYPHGSIVRMIIHRYKCDPVYEIQGKVPKSNFEVKYVEVEKGKSQKDGWVFTDWVTNAFKNSWKLNLF